MVLNFLSDGLFCYQCGSVQSSGECKEDIQGLTEAGSKVMKELANSTDGEVTDGSWNKDRTLPYIKECAAPRNICIIEEVVNSRKGYVVDMYPFMERF